VSPPEAGPGDAVEATLSVENVGRVRGTETVQLYVSALGSRVVRAPSDLRAFAQVTLAPGERRTVTLRFEVADLAFWNEARRAFEVEPLDYEVRVGAHAGDPGQTARFRVR
jgi:beta-glucosidase